MNYPLFDPSWPTSHVTLTQRMPSSWTVHILTHHSLSTTQCWCEEMQSLCMNCPHSDPSQPTSHTMLMRGDAKFMHELSTLWPITAHLPHNADARRCKVYAWTVHTLTHHSPPPTCLQCWWKGRRQGRGLSTLLLTTAYLPHNNDRRRSCQVHAWTVHTLTRHGPPPMWHWRWHWQGMMPSSWTVNTFTHHSLPPTQCWQ